MLFKTCDIFKAGHLWSDCSTSFGAHLTRQFQFSAHQFWVGHSWRLHASDTTCHFSSLDLLCLPLLSLSKQDCPTSRECFTPPFCGFAFVREPCHFSATIDHISVLWSSAQNESPNISTTLLQFSSDFGIDDRFGTTGSKWSGTKRL
ncbi:hypothetical protein AVEN_51416-1 [Araneus ventricosus]|uniref:Uncharacterized protein n=1 Tax=Araneus ventricosus TaxID=182803 RepID=A0A4Y2N6M4_ARAVE|nr:hypothetical protein AVEN_51416-1 [Araneus ventricosus]